MMTEFQQRTKAAHFGSIEDKMVGLGCVAASASISLAIMFWAARLLLEKSMLM